jgi:hypothetical protein
MAQSSREHRGKERTSPSPVPITPTARTSLCHERGNHRLHRPRGACHSSAQNPAPLWGISLISPTRPEDYSFATPVDVQTATHPRTMPHIERDSPNRSTHRHDIQQHSPCPPGFRHRHLPQVRHLASVLLPARGGVKV